MIPTHQRASTPGSQTRATLGSTFAPFRRHSRPVLSISFQKEDESLLAAKWDKVCATLPVPLPPRPAGRLVEGPPP